MFIYVIFTLVTVFLKFGKNCKHKILSFYEPIYY